MLFRNLFLAVCIASLALSAQADDWNSFRGPQGDGVSHESGFPTTWGPNKNIKWKIPLPAPSNGSPIVSNGRVFLTLAENDGKKRSLYCFDGNDGHELWARSVALDKKMPTHKSNPHGSSTPAANGQVVVAWHSSAGLVCYDFDGNQLWSRDLGEFKHMWGSGGSPIIYRDRVILNCGPGKRVFLTALDLESGKTIWKQEEPQDNENADTRADGNYKGSWSTPIIARIDGQDQIVCSMTTRVSGYDLATGKIIWSCDGLSGPKGDLAYSSPMVSDEFCVAIAGFGGPSIGFRLGGSGNITESNRQWRNARNPQSIGTGILHDGFVYRVNAASGPLIECLESKTGKTVWRGPRGGAGWASIVMADGILFATNQKATTFVFKLNPEKYELLAQNNLNETCNATPALSDGKIFIRTYGHLYCISQTGN